LVIGTPPHRGGNESSTAPRHSSGPCSRLCSTRGGRLVAPLLGAGRLAGRVAAQGAGGTPRQQQQRDGSQHSLSHAHASVHVLVGWLFDVPAALPVPDLIQGHRHRQTLTVPVALTACFAQL
jgi:hypothetical protein